MKNFKETYDHYTFINHYDSNLKASQSKTFTFYSVPINYSVKIFKPVSSEILQNFDLNFSFRIYLAILKIIIKKIYNQTVLGQM